MGGNNDGVLAGEGWWVAAHPQYAMHTARIASGGDPLGQLSIAMHAIPLTGVQTHMALRVCLPLLAVCIPAHDHMWHDTNSVMTL